MTDFELYVAEPAEAAPRQRLATAAPTIVLLIVLLLGGHVARAVIQAQAEQDPALGVPQQDG